MRLTPHIYLIASGDLGFSMTGPLDCNVYLVDCGEGAVLIDAGAGLEPERMDALLACHGLRYSHIRHLLLTHAHADHACGAARIQALSGCAVHCPTGELAAVTQGIPLRSQDQQEDGSGKRRGFYPPGYRYLPCPGATGLEDGQVIRCGQVSFTCLEVPGHSAHSMAVLAHLDGRRCLFTGDTVFARGRLLLQPSTDAPLNQYAHSLERLAALEAEALFPGHGAFSLHRGNRHLTAALSYFRRGLLPPQLELYLPQELFYYDE